MPEAPDLEVVKEVLARRVKGLAAEQARVLRPLELRVLTSTDFSGDVAGRSFLDFSRKGKFLLMALSGERMLVVNPNAHRRTQALPPLGAISQENVLPAVPIRRLRDPIPG